MENPLNKIALVTGANKGIGFEAARQLAASGCSVLLGARNRALGEEAAATLKRDGFDVRYLSIDLDDPATLAAAAREIERDFGHLDILVNNAGIAAQGDGLPSSVSLDAIERDFRVNFLGSVAVTQAMLPLLRKASSATDRECVERTRLADEERRPGMDPCRREVSRLRRIEGSSQYAHRATRLRTARHVDQSEFSRPGLHGNRS